MTAFARRLRPIVVAALLMMPCTVVQAQSARADIPQAIATLPFELFYNGIYLQAQVNGSRPLWFVLDSGASGCIVDLIHARALGLKTKDTVQGRGAGAGTVDVVRLEDTYASLPGVDALIPVLMAIDLSGNLAQIGRPLDGILGYEFFQRFVVQVDYDTQVLRFFDPKSYRTASHPIPFTLKKNRPHISAAIKVAGREPQTLEVLVDSGSADGVDVDLISQSTAPKLVVVGGVGLGKEYQVIAGPVERFQVADIVLEGAHGVSGGVQLIGGEVLKRFTVTFDYSRSHMHLEPNSHYHDPFRFDASGLDLRFVPQLRAFAVHSVLKDSPADGAGLREGDVILALDGTPSSAFTLPQAVALLQRNGALYRLTVKRGDAVLTLPLQLRKLM